MPYFYARNKVLPFRDSWWRLFELKWSVIAWKVNFCIAVSDSVISPRFPV